jgi:hypothetical protein
MQLGAFVGQLLHTLLQTLKPKHIEYVKYVLKDYFSTRLICVHAPTEEKDDDEMDNFYEYLDQIYEECPNRGVNIIIGDLNAKIGQEELYRPINGKYNLHTLSNDNGIKTYKFCMF